MCTSGSEVKSTSFEGKWATEEMVLSSWLDCVAIRGKSASGAHISQFLSALKRLRRTGTKSYGLSRNSRNWHVIKEQPSGWCHVMMWQSFQWCLSGATSGCDTIKLVQTADPINRMRNGTQDAFIRLVTTPSADGNTAAAIAFDKLSRKSESSCQRVFLLRTLAMQSLRLPQLQQNNVCLRGSRWHCR